MPFPGAIEQWRSLAEQERGSTPTDLILAIIGHESGGKAGVGAYRPSAAVADLPTRAGKLIRIDRAFGLMQVIPTHYKRLSGIIVQHPITVEDISGTDAEAARLQIRAGRSIWESGLTWLHAQDPQFWPWPVREPTDDQILIGLMVYAIGPATIGRAIADLRRANIEPSFSAIARRWPRLGGPANKPIEFAKKIWKAYKQSPSIAEKTKGGAFAAIMLGLLAWKMLGKKKKKERET